MNADLLHDPAVRLAGLLLLITLCADVLLRRVRRRLEHDAAEASAREKTANGGAASAGEARAGRTTRRDWLEAIVPPLSLGVWFYGVYAAVRVLTALLPAGAHTWQERLVDCSGVGAFVAALWLLHRVSRLVENRLAARAARTESTLDDVLLPLAGSALRVVLPTVALFFLVRLWPLAPDTVAILRKLAAVAMIFALAWLVVRAAGLIETTVTRRRDVAAMNDFAGRAVVTRARVLRRVTTVLTGLLALAATLMLFDEVRDIGRGILASAGLAGLVIGFAAQRSLANLFAGLQIAFTQPIRLGDQVSAAGETGIVEEITFTYVVLAIWDGRRLIVPIAHFVENPVVNFTRNSTNQMAVLLLRADFSLPVAPLRAFLKNVIERSPHWDRKTFDLHVTGSPHESMELRVIGSAGTPGAAFALQCELREQALGFIHQRYPQCLPKAREEGKPMLRGWQETEEFAERDVEAARRRARPEVGSADGAAPSPANAPAQELATAGAPAAGTRK